MSGQFSRSQKSSYATRAKDRSQIADETFDLVSMAEVVDTGAPGAFRVRLLGRDAGAKGPITVRALSPHASNKPSSASSGDLNDFEDSQTASGMVTPTPSIGTRGIVVMANGKATSGYWLGSIMPAGLGQTIPDFSTSSNVSGEKGDLDELASPVGLPVAEINPTATDGSTPNTRIKRAVHPFAKVLQRQGLLVDTVRGQTTSSALRDSNSGILGFNTPGGVGTRESLISNRGENAKPTSTPLKLTRLGGHTFTMDDGDDRGKNNLVRIRSSKGAQILFHDTNELVYIGNQNGTAWIEMTADGKIDMYAKDSVSIHSEADFNFRADRDINFEAGRTLNMRGVKKTYIDTNELRVVARVDGRIDVRGDLDLTTLDTRWAVNNLSINSDNLDITNKLNTQIKTGELDLVSQFGMRHSAGHGIELKTNVAENLVWKANTYNSDKVYYKGNTVIFNSAFFQAVTQTIAPNTPGVKVPPGGGPAWIPLPFAIPKTLHGDLVIDTNIAGPKDGQLHVTTKGDAHLTVLNGKINMLASKEINITTPSTVYVDGTTAVHLNLPGPGATPAIPIVLPALSTNIPIPYETSAEGNKNIADLGVFENEKTDSSKTWSEGYYASDESLFSIMKRIPMHEPWSGHESLDKALTSSASTDREV